MAEVNEISQPLVDRFDDLATEHDNGRSANGDVERMLRMLSRSCDGFHIWELDLAFKEYPLKPKTLAMRNMKARDVLLVLEACQMSVVEDLHRIFKQIEMNLPSLSRFLQCISEYNEEDWTSESFALENAAEAIAQSVTELEEREPIIYDQFICATSSNNSKRAVLEYINGGATLLSIDGGGVKSYSSILIIKALMDHVDSIMTETNIEVMLLQTRTDTNFVGVPRIGIDKVRPRDVFDYIFGSSSGGLIAIMLGRLEMSVEQCVEWFRNYADEVFGHPRLLSRALGRVILPKYSEERSTRAILNAIEDFELSKDSVQWDQTLFAQDRTHCKIGVTAWRLQDSGGNRHMFRSYTGSPLPDQAPESRPAATCQIWEVARAACAARGYFSAVKINGESFMDGEVAASNPTHEALSEIEGFRKGFSLKPLVISIGSGLKPQNTAPGSLSSDPKSVTTTMEALKSVAGNTEDVHEDMERTSEAQGIEYFRFNVDCGLEDLLPDSWRVKKVDGRKIFETIETITRKTDIYLHQQQVAENLHRCAQILVDRYQRDYRRQCVFK